MRTREQPGADHKKKIIIVDDHPLLRAGLGQVINQQEDMVVCGEAGDCLSGLAVIAGNRPDAVITDISLDGGSGLDLIKDIHARYPGLPVLALSVHHENLYAERAIFAGAQGYVMKREPVDALMAALRKVMVGHMAVSANIVSRLIGQRGRGTKPVARAPADLLSDRELEVFRLYGEGAGTAQVAAKLGLAVSTVESYRGAIKQKLGLATGTEFIARAGRLLADEAGG